MEKHLKTKGIILRRIDLNEADQILTILTQDKGKMSLMAKGSRRVKSKFCGKLELFYRGEFTYFQGQSLGHLNEVESICLLEERGLDLDSRGLLFYLAEVTLKLLPEEETCEEIYELLNTTLMLMDATHAEALFFGYLVKLLTQLGYMTDWSQCPVTEKKLDLSQNYFLSEGQLQAHNSEIEVPAHLIKWVSFMQKNPLSELKQVKASVAQKQEVFLILKSILAGLFDFQPRSEKFMQALSFKLSLSDQIKFDHKFISNQLIS